MKDIPDIEPFRKRIEELDEIMNSPDFYQNQRRVATIGREYQKVSEFIELYEELNKLHEDTKENKALAEDSSADAELREMAKEELQAIEERMDKMADEVIFRMIPPDPSDSRNTIIEIRAGAGGNEASIFAGDLSRMYIRYTESRGWRIENMGSNPSELGGYKEIAFLVTGEDVYRQLKYESGVHRVQRVPATETQGRVHTSTATVAVLPEAEEVDIDINIEDLDITVCRASGPGGQGVNTTDSAVQILHKPTGVTVYCADERSQQKNRVKALKVLRSRLLKAKEGEERAKYAANRRSQIGTGDRSERIRTYNFPQNRITDHRIGYTAHNLPEMMEGDLDPIIIALQEADKAERVQELLKG